MAGEEEQTKSKGFRLLGILDVQNTPCARDAVLHGAGGSLTAGLLHFLATSESELSVSFLCPLSDCFTSFITGFEN